MLGCHQPRRQVSVRRQHRLQDISSYAIDRFGQLTLISSFAINASTGGDIDARLSPDGRSLLVVGGKSDVISVFAVNGGTLSEYPSSPTGLRPMRPPRPGSPSTRTKPQKSVLRYARNFTPHWSAHALPPRPLSGKPS